MTAYYHMNDDPEMPDEGFVWTVTDFHNNEGYSNGSGIAVVLDRHGKIWNYGLNDDSFYGPLNDCPEELSADSFLNEQVLDSEFSSELILKVQELLNESD